MMRLARYLGAAASLVLVVWLLQDSLGQLPRLDFSSAAVLQSLAAALGFYVLSQLMIALAWRWTLRAFSQPAAPLVAESQFLASQIAKYLPGNVAHLLGRAILARRDGFALPRVTLAMAAEVALVLVSAGFVTLALLGFDAELRHRLLGDIRSVGWPVAVPALLAVAAVALAFGARRHLAGKETGPAIKWRRVAPGLVKPGLLHLATFLLHGLSLGHAAAAVAPEVALPLGLSVAVFAAAWSIGFITPGAPGGLGLRDGLIAIGLGPVTGLPAALAIALLHRVICVLGDVLVFGLGLGLRRRLLPARADG